MKKINKMIEKYHIQAQNKLIDILVGKHKLEKQNAIHTAKIIAMHAFAEMQRSFVYQDGDSANDFLSSKNDLFAAMIRNKENVPFVHWSWTALRIPFYQSVGDTIGYFNGRWEFNYGNIRAGPEYSNEMLYEFIALGGINNLSIENWKASDDTILYIATMEILGNEIDNVNESTKKLVNLNTNSNDANTLPDNIIFFGEKLRNAYLASRSLIENRDPGQTTMDSLAIQENKKWDQLSYNSRAIGNGSAMRSGCIGIFYPGKFNRLELISRAIESSRITHNSTVANLGSVTAALFTAYALEKKPVNIWPRKLFKFLQSSIIDDYMKKYHSDEFPQYDREKTIFIGQWDNYLNRRFNGTQKIEQKFMKNIVERYKYLSENFSKGCDIPGACADDALIFAYDALLQSEGVLEKVVIYSALHPGDSDTVASIALSWYGAYYHTIDNEICAEHYFENLEFKKRLIKIFNDNIYKMLKIYYYDIYLDFASRQIKQFVDR